MAKLHTTSQNTENQTGQCLRERDCLACLEERESVDKSTVPGFSTLSLSSRQAMPSSPSP